MLNVIYPPLYAECRYAECRGAVITAYSATLSRHYFSLTVSAVAAGLEPMTNE